MGFDGVDALCEIECGEFVDGKAAQRVELGVVEQFDQRLQHAADAFHRQHERALAHHGVGDVVLRQIAVAHVAQHVDDEREQRDALAVDLDADVDVEPVAALGFETRVPRG